MPGHDTALLVEAAVEAGKIAASYFRTSLNIRDKGDGQGPVTEADLAVNQYLLEKLRAARPDYGWLSEESEDDDARISAERIFVIDPIDGTRAFIEGQPTFAQALAVVEKGRVISGVVHLPVREETFVAERGAGATLNGQPVRISSDVSVDDAHMLSGRANMEPHFWKSGAAPGFTRHMRPSLAYRMCLVANGRFDGMLTLRDTWEWDVAAGTLIIEEAGGAVSTQAGKTPIFNNSRPMLNGIVAAGPALHAQLIERIA